MGGPHGGWGGEAGENGSTPELSRPAYLCQRIRARDEPAGSTQFPRRGRNRGAQREGALPAPEGDTALSPTHLNPLMAGTVTTRKHVRTHVLSTQPVWARARQHPSPAPPTFVPPLATPCLSAGRPAPCRDGLVVHMRTLRCTDFGPPTIFPSSSTWLSMRNWYLSNTAGLFPPFSGFSGGKVGVHAPLGIYLRCQGNTRTSRLQASF